MDKGGEGRGKTTFGAGEKREREGDRQTDRWRQNEKESHYQELKLK